MRRTITTLGAAAAGAALLLTVPQSASAAQGTLTVSGATYQNPSGCYTGRFFPLIVANNTNQPAFVSGGPNCSGQTLGVVRPGQRGTFEFGQSVRIR